MSIDPAVSLALAVHAHKGVYALLVGSGISRAAGIPTGWEVVSDLTRRAAVASGDPDPGENAEKWYRDTFHAEPDYSKLLEMIAATPTERMSLLRDYFEPTEEERERGVKVPTAAHKAIARLVAGGYIKVIVTTNFDRLLEQAIQAEGINPAVVSSPDHIAGMMPLPHVQCVIVKIHGDYLDTRIKNTPSELADYDVQSNALLDRIFTEYGLIACGWSGDWDPALAGAILRTTRHRFTTYWLAHGKLSTRANDLVRHRQAVAVPITSADAAFTDLERKIEAIESQRMGDPMSPRLAVITMKRYLSEDRHRIALEDLVVGELNAVKQQLAGDKFPLGDPLPTKETYRERVERMELMCSRLVPVATTGAYWGDAKWDGLWRRCIVGLSQAPQVRGGFFDTWLSLRYYPAALVLYGAGLAAVARRRYALLKSLLIDPIEFEQGDPRPPAAYLGSPHVLQGDSAQWLYDSDGKTKRRTPGSDWMCARLQPMLSDILGGDTDFEMLFDEFEILMSLASSGAGDITWGGRFVWRGARRDGHPHVKRLAKEISSSASPHPLLKAGFCNGDQATAEKALQTLAERINQIW